MILALSDLFAARAQMAFTLGFHIALACFGIGLPVLMLAAEGMFLRTGDEGWRTLARRWSKAFAVLFAVGAVSGTVLSFELGLLWPEFMARWSAVFGLCFSLEGFAFFLEAVFVGIYLYGWDRLSPRVHWLTGVPIAISGACSGWFVLTVNAWMNNPVGFDMDPVTGELLDVRLGEMFFNSVAGAMTVHMLVAAYMVTGCAVAAFYGWRRLRGHDGQHERRAFALGCALALPLAPIQAGVGHATAEIVGEVQPNKIAAMKAQYRTERRAPLRIGGWVDDEAEETRFALEIPGLLSLMLHGDVDAEVVGLDRTPNKADRPPVAVVYQGFQVMVGCGSALIGIALWAALGLALRRRLPDSRRFLWAAVASGPLALLAMEAGWVVTEVGRQPWVVQGKLRTAEAVTTAPGVPLVFASVVALYAVLGVTTVAILRGLAARPLPGAEA